MGQKILTPSIFLLILNSYLRTGRRHYCGKRGSSYRGW